MTGKQTNQNDNSLAPLAELLPGWYMVSHRALPWRENTDPYRIWISEIMLQQTRVEAVKDYFLRFVSALPDIYTLAAVPEERLLKLWEGLGYYSRARNLQKTALLLCRQYNGALPARYEALLQLPGIGPYTAGAIASIAFGLPIPAVDGNVLRVFSRFTADTQEITAPAYKKKVFEQLEQIIPAGNPGVFNQAVMELGATICLPNGRPLCENCPLKSCCEGRRQGVAALLPNKAAPRARRQEQKTILLLHADQLLAIRRRPARGLLAGLWELPWLPGKLEPDQVTAAVREMGVMPLRVTRAGEARHIFTHIEWEMSGYIVSVEEPRGQETLVWADAVQLAERYPLPSAFAFYLQSWKERFAPIRQP